MSLPAGPQQPEPSGGAPRPQEADCLSADDVRAQVERIAASQAFARSGRLSRLLRFTVEKTLRGEAAEVREYLLGVEVFEKGPEFDQRTDTIVRVAARRLRLKLQGYYETEGKGDAIWIGFRKGSYVPVIRSQKVEALDRGSRAVRARRAVALATAALAVIAAVTAYVVARSGARPSSIAVLPFANLSTDPENEYFTEGVAEELTAALSKVEGLRVVARASARQFKGTREDVSVIGGKLGAGLLVGGSVRRSGGRVRVAAQLVRVRDGQQLWSEIYERDTGDAFDVQNDIAEAIAKALKLRLAPRPAVAAKPSAATIEARNLYFRGRYFRNRRTLEGLHRSIALFEQAAAKDPQLAGAHAALADCYAMLGFHGLAPVHEAISRAKAAAHRALKIDETNAKAHGGLAWIHFSYDWDWPAAQREFRRALELDPDWANIHQWYAFGLLSRGRFEEAIAESEKATELDPLVYVASNDLAVIHYFARRYEPAMRRARQTLEMDPDLGAAHVVLGMCLAATGRGAEAVAEARRGLDATARFTLAAGRLGYAQAIAGRHGEARATLAQLGEASGQSHPYMQQAFVHTALGEKDRALEALEKAFERREGELVFLRVERAFDPLRPDPRFQALLKRAGLAD